MTSGDDPFHDCELDPEAILGTHTFEDVLFTDETETPVNVLTGETPVHSQATVEEATEFEVEYTVLGAIDVGIDDVETIRERVLSSVRMLSDDQKHAVDDAIDSLVDQHILKRDGGTVRLQ
ncbi:hypothetical protein C2R22_21720 (plasmid) [Salinigranum rubrum]|uniref:Uncharacterized protein n=1 Tax=Salinigranum rubrum TaxID=755307 RepID=A0A2I8VQJ5_9EURY|nr:hypothetical protein [Salinigranum rubrum]AUV84191.1 hypothetical protein C2R22_21720 [Salinigranum rubrum]